jgi:hypothetical protein
VTRRNLRGGNTQPPANRRASAARGRQQVAATKAGASADPPACRSFEKPGDLMQTSGTASPAQARSTPMNVETQIPLLEDVLGRWRQDLGGDFTAYRNHVYRVVHFCCALRTCGSEEREKVVIAGAFHDLGIWSDKTVDYLPPSAALANGYLLETGREAWVPEIEGMILLHHKLRRVDPAQPALTEVFRQADLVDLSLGLVRFGLSGARVAEIRSAFPNAGFHQRLGRLAAGWFAKHPFSPPPFLKW